MVPPRLVSTRRRRVARIDAAVRFPLLCWSMVSLSGDGRLVVVDDKREPLAGCRQVRHEWDVGLHDPGALDVVGIAVEPALEAGQLQLVVPAAQGRPGRDDIELEVGPGVELREVR